MKTKSKVLISALLVIALCVSLIAGTTFALFSSEDRVNVTVSSGKVEVKASVADNSVQTVQLNKEYAVGLNNVSEDASVAVDGNKVSLINAVAGDGVKFVVNVVNNSTVTVQYRTKIVIEGKGASQLTVNVDGKKLSSNQTSLWQTLAVPANDSAKNVGQVAIEVLIPSEATGSEAIDCSVKYVVEAVQGNADVENDPALYSASMAETLADDSVKEVELTQDLDLHNTYAQQKEFDVDIIAGLSVEEDSEQIEAIIADFANEMSRYPALPGISTVEKVKKAIKYPDGDWQNRLVKYLNSDLPLLVDGVKTIDLGGKQLTVSDCINVVEGGELIIKNGTLVISKPLHTYGITVAQNTKLTLDGVNLTVKGGIKVNGDLVIANSKYAEEDFDEQQIIRLCANGNVTVDNSELETKGSFLVYAEPNAKSLTVSNSTLTCGGDVGYESAKWYLRNDGIYLVDGCKKDIKSTTLVTVGSINGTEVGVGKTTVYDAEGNVVE